MRNRSLTFALGGFFLSGAIFGCSADEGSSGTPTGGTSSSGGGTSTGSATSSGGATNGDGGTASGSAASGGAGTGSTASSGGQSSALFTEDFEALALGDVTTPWKNTLPTNYDSMGIVEVTTSKAHGGTKSVHVKKGNDGQAFLQIEGAPVFPWSSAGIYVRAYFLVPEWPTNHASWMEVGATTNETDEFRFGEHEGVLQINHWPGDQDQIASGQVLTANEWHCYEYFYDPTAKKIRVWVEETEVTGLAADGDVARGDIAGAWPSIAALRFGAEIAATEIWFDDIAVGTEPIGCL